MPPQGFAIEKVSSLEIVAAYSAPQSKIRAVAASPGWYVIGGFYLPKSTRARLDILGLVTDDGDLVLRGRLFQLRTGALGDFAEVSGSRVQLASEVPLRVLSGVVELTGNRNYQIQAECVGGDDISLFGLVYSATITD